MSGADRTFAAAPDDFAFRGLESFTRFEAGLWNWRQQFLGGVGDWKTWMQDAWGDLLLAPAGLEVALAQTHSVETQSEPRKYSFHQREILIGRDPASDIVLETVAAGKRHARIFVEHGRCFLEDLGSSLGTYWNQARVAPNQRRVLQSGDQVAIFPYVFTVNLRQLWARQLDVNVYAGVAEPMTWEDFQATSTTGRDRFAIDVHPVGVSMLLEVSRSFLMDMADRILAPLGVDGAPSILGCTDRALFEFMIACLLERANRDLSFPFQFDIAATGTEPAMPRRENGVCMACSVSLLAATGALRIFMPYRSMDAMRQAAPPPPQGAASTVIAWKFPVSLGSVSVSAAELAGLEVEDVLIPSFRLELLLPHRFDRGWTALPEDSVAENSAGLRNLSRLRIDKYFEREPVNTEDAPPDTPAEPNRAPDLSRLPVRVHVILADKELTLPEAAALTKGSILDLECEKTGVVTLAVNGKVLGEGQLVDIEGRLGVRILSWRGA
jgi:type III secretion system YscQ/HrcQ family protein